MEKRRSPMSSWLIFGFLKNIFLFFNGIQNCLELANSSFSQIPMLWTFLNAFIWPPFPSHRFRPSFASYVEYWRRLWIRSFRSHYGGTIMTSFNSSSFSSSWEIPNISKAVWLGSCWLWGHGETFPVTLCPIRISDVCRFYFCRMQESNGKEQWPNATRKIIGELILFSSFL